MVEGRKKSFFGDDKHKLVFMESCDVMIEALKYGTLPQMEGSLAYPLKKNKKIESQLLEGTTNQFDIEDIMNQKD
jgi:hypothetical protein